MCLSVRLSVCPSQTGILRQVAQLSQRDRATLYVRPYVYAMFHAMFYAAFYTVPACDRQTDRRTDT